MSTALTVSHGSPVAAIPAADAERARGFALRQRLANFYSLRQLFVNAAIAASRVAAWPCAAESRESRCIRR